MSADALPPDESPRGSTIRRDIENGNVYFVHSLACCRAPMVRPADLAAACGLPLDTPVLLVNPRLTCRHWGAS